MPQVFLRPSIQSRLALLTAVTGLVLSDDDVGKPEYELYISSVQHSVQDYDVNLINVALFGHAIPTTTTLTNGLFRFLAQLVQFAKIDDGFSIDEAITHLASNSTVVCIDMEEEGQRDVARHVIFAALGWTSGLYSPKAPTTPTMQQLRIRVDEPYAVQPLDRCERPFSELLELLSGSFFPGKMTDTFETGSTEVHRTTIEDPLAFDSFVVEHMNAASLERLGELNIVWVDDMTSHLVFDRLKSTLRVFRMPSFCHIQSCSESLASKLIDSIYNEYDRPDKFSVDKFFKEILLSYRLLFGEDRNSRKLYRKHAFSRQYGVRPSDCTLDQLCRTAQAREEERADVAASAMGLFHLERWFGESRPSTISFSKHRSFPFLRDRLEHVQEYMLRRQPNHFWTLWIDRRDKPKWLTFWGVLIFGTLGVVLSFIQTVIAGVQMQTGFRSLVCGCASNTH